MTHAATQREVEQIKAIYTDWTDVLIAPLNILHAEIHSMAERINKLVEALDKVVTQAHISGKREGSHRLFRMDDFTQVVEDAEAQLADYRGTKE